MASKNYVCQQCKGTGETEVNCEDERCDHQNEGCVAGRAGPCPSCAKRGFPPTVVASKPGGASDAVVQVNFPLAVVKLPGHARGCAGAGCAGECAASPCPHGKAAAHCGECQP